MTLHLISQHDALIGMYIFTAFSILRLALAIYNYRKKKESNARLAEAFGEFLKRKGDPT